MIRWTAIAAFALGMAAPGFAAEKAEPRRVWPLPLCGEHDIVVASPAPVLKDSASLNELPFGVWMWPMTAAFIVALDDKGAALPQCLIAETSNWQIARPAMVAVAGLSFASPRTPNVAAPGGRYLVRMSTNLGSSWVDPPPPDPLLPLCAKGFGGPWAPKWMHPPELAPVTRVHPVYPPRALREAIEGDVTIVLSTFSSGAASPACISRTTPPGWFEAAAARAVSQWTFKPLDGMGRYSVTVRFKLQ